VLLEKGGDGVPGLRGAGLKEEVGTLDFMCVNVRAGAADAAQGAAADQAILRGGEAEEGDRAVLEVICRVYPGGIVHAVSEDQRVVGADGAVEILHGIARSAVTGDEEPQQKMGKWETCKDEGLCEVAKQSRHGWGDEAATEDDRADAVWLFAGELKGEGAGERFAEEDEVVGVGELGFEVGERGGMGGAGIGGI